MYGRASLPNEVECGGIIVEDAVLQLSRQIDIDGLGRREIVRVEHRIMTIREVGADLHFRHGGQNLKDGTSFHDLGTFGGCLSDAVDDARSSCTAFGITDESSLELVIVAYLQQTFVFPSADGEPPRTMFGRRRYSGVPKDWFPSSQTDRVIQWENARRGKGAWPKGRMPSMESSVIARRQVWSSKHPAEKNSAAIAKLLKDWARKDLVPDEGCD